MPNWEYKKVMLKRGETFEADGDIRVVDAYVRGEVCIVDYLERTDKEAQDAGS